MPRLIAKDRRGVRYFRGAYDTEKEARVQAKEVLAEEPTMAEVILTGEETFTVKEVITR